MKILEHWEAKEVELIKKLYWYHNRVAGINKQLDDVRKKIDELKGE